MLLVKLCTLNLSLTLTKIFLFSKYEKSTWTHDGVKNSRLPLGRLPIIDKDPRVSPKDVITQESIFSKLATKTTNKRICFEKLLSEFFQEFIKYPYLNEREKYNHKNKLTEIIALYKAVLHDQENIKGIIAECAKVVRHGGGVDSKANRTAEYKYNLMKQLPQFCENFIKNYFAKDNTSRKNLDNFIWNYTTNLSGENGKIQEYLWETERSKFNKDYTKLQNLSLETIWMKKMCHLFNLETCHILNEKDYIFKSHVCYVMWNIYLDQLIILKANTCIMPTKILTTTIINLDNVESMEAIERARTYFNETIILSERAPTEFNARLDLEESWSTRSNYLSAVEFAETRQYNRSQLKCGLLNNDSKEGLLSRSPNPTYRELSETMSSASKFKELPVYSFIFDNNRRISCDLIDIHTAEQLNVELTSFRKFYFFARNYYPYRLPVKNLRISQIDLELIHSSLSELERLIALGVLHNPDNEGTDVLRFVNHTLWTEPVKKFNFGASLVNTLAKSVVKLQPYYPILKNLENIPSNEKAARYLIFFSKEAEKIANSRTITAMNSWCEDNSTTLSLILEICSV